MAGQYRRAGSEPVVPFGDGPPSGPTVYHQDRVGGRLLRVEDGHRQMADVPWVPVAGHLEFGGNRALWAIDRFELGSVDGRGVRTTGGCQEGGEGNHGSDHGAGTLHRVHRTHRGISRWCPSGKVQSRAGVKWVR